MRLTGLVRIGKEIGKLSIPISLLSLGGCATTTIPVPRTDGNVERLMSIPEYKEVKDSNPSVKRWAWEALNTVNDLEYQLKK